MRILSDISRRKNTVFSFTIKNVKMGTFWVFWKFQLLFRQKYHYWNTSAELFPPCWIVSIQQIMAAATGFRFHPFFCWEQNNSLSVKIALTTLLYIYGTSIIFLWLRSLLVTQDFPCCSGTLCRDHSEKIHPSINQSIKSIPLCLYNDSSVNQCANLIAICPLPGR